MKLFTDAFLNEWEARATQRGERWEKEHPPKWYLFLSPDLSLLPTERYTFGLCIRRNLQIIFVIAINFVFWLLPSALLWYKDPIILHNPKYHKTLIGFLSDTGFYIFPWTILLFLTLAVILTLPRFYFWNRRAERLRREPPLPGAPAESVATDTSVWPPPPKKLVG